MRSFTLLFFCFFLVLNALFLFFFQSYLSIQPAKTELFATTVVIGLFILVQALLFLYFLQRSAMIVETLEAHSITLNKPVRSGKKKRLLIAVDLEEDESVVERKRIEVPGKFEAYEQELNHLQGLVETFYRWPELSYLIGLGGTIIGLLLAISGSAASTALFQKFGLALITTLNGVFTVIVLKWRYEGNINALFEGVKRASENLLHFNTVLAGEK